RRHTRFSRDWSSDVCSSDLANYILPITSMPIKDGIVAVDEEGVIQGIYDSTSFAPIDKAKVERYNGVIIPGFINAHCHIELSHRSEEGRVGKECRSRWPP